MYRLCSQRGLHLNDQNVIRTEATLIFYGLTEGSNSIVTCENSIKRLLRSLACKTGSEPKWSEELNMVTICILS